MDPLQFQAALLKMNLEFLENLSKSLDIAIETMKENNKILEPLMKATDGETIKTLNFAAENWGSNHPAAVAAIRNLNRKL